MDRGEHSGSGGQPHVFRLAVVSITAFFLRVAEVLREHCISQITSLLTVVMGRQAGQCPYPHGRAHPSMLGGQMLSRRS